jgi:formylmethanofuran dehydrogenase subunit A
VTIYSEQEDREAMFATPRYVIKGGRVIAEDGELRDAPPGTLLRVAPQFDDAIEGALGPLFEEHYSVEMASYPVREPWLLEPARRVPAARGGGGGGGRP